MMWARLYNLPSLVLIFMSIVSLSLTDDYRSQRSQFLQNEDAMALGGHLPNKNREQIANNVLMTAKREELAKGLQSPTSFAPSRNFLDVRKIIEQSEVFKFIKKMPKGAVLHAHDMAFVSEEYLFNITYSKNLYVCEVGNKPGDKLALHFFDKPDDKCDWKLVSDIRKNLEAAESLDKRIHDEMSMLNSSASKTDYDNGNAAWEKFTRIFEFITPMLLYRHVFVDHYYQGLQEQYDDNVIYLEIRSTLPPVYELNETVYSPIDVARMYKEVTDRFVRDHPKFVGAKLIYAPLKTADARQFDEYASIAVQLKQTLPEFFAGFDLVGHEEGLTPLATWIDKIQSIQKDIPFFFHAGETNWYGMSIDENLVDAVLMNTIRIGNGYALAKHPKVMKIVKSKKIGVEICPISNQVLSLVKDLRNHPASFLFSTDFPVVVSNDYPGLWGAKGLSYDFYEAFMGIMSAHADIRAIKQLALNSIEFSSLNNTEKVRAMRIFTGQWNAFTRSFYSKNNK